MARTSSKDLPTFSGNAEEWPTFSTMLRTTTEQCCFSNVENMIRLQKALKGRARDFVLPLLTVPENTPQVIRTVEKRFGRPDVVVQTLIEQTKSFSGLKDGELKLLLDFSNAVCNLVETMRLMSCDGHQNNPQLRQELVGKLPTTLRLQWGEFAAKQESPLTLTKFSTWLSERADAVCEIL